MAISSPTPVTKPTRPARNQDPRGRRGGHGLSLGRWGGIPVSANWTTLFLLALFAETLAVGVLPSARPGLAGAVYWLPGVATPAVFLASLLAPQLAPPLPATRNGRGARRGRRRLPGYLAGPRTGPRPHGQAVRRGRPRHHAVAPRRGDRTGRRRVASPDGRTDRGGRAGGELRARRPQRARRVVGRFGDAGRLGPGLVGRRQHPARRLQPASRGSARRWPGVAGRPVGPLGRPGPGRGVVGPRGPRTRLRAHRTRAVRGVRRYIGRLVARPGRLVRHRRGQCGAPSERGDRAQGHP